MTIIDPQKCRGGLKPEMWNDPEYWAEFKFHGCRYMMHCHGEYNKFLSRHISVKGGYVDKSNSLPHLRDIPTQKIVGTILDGEIILDLFGTVRDVTSILGSSTELAIQKQNERGLLKYMAFDMPYYCGKDIRQYAYAKRKILLHDVLRKINNPYLIEVAYINRNKRNYYNDIVKKGGEGIVLKYSFGKYGEKRHWIKVKHTKTFDVIITGFLNPSSESIKKGENKATITKYAQKGWIGSIEIGMYHTFPRNYLPTLVNVGSVSGIDESTREKMSKNPKAYIGKVIEIEAQSQLKSGKFEHPRFIRLRPDKENKECVYGEHNL